MALAGSILEEIADDWRELVAGSEGYLTSPTRRGLHRWPVAWGEQDSMVRFFSTHSVFCSRKSTALTVKLRHLSGD